ncbi:MAG: lantibiotic dehydratase [Haliangiales bacterium]
MLRAEAQFVFRTPLLSIDTFLAWSAELPDWSAGDGVVGDGSLSPRERGALAQARAQARAYLRQLLVRPVVSEALFVASPGLADSLARWQREPESARGQKIERALVRYVARMATRATPFGLFSGVSCARVSDDADEPTQLSLSPTGDYQRSTRLDNDYLFALASALRRDPAIRRSLRWKPNSSIYEISGHLRYAEARLHGKLRTYHLVGVEANAYLEATLTRAQAGATCQALADALVDSDPEIAADEAMGFIDELIDSQLLVCELDPAVTGSEPIVGMLALLREHAPDAPATSGLAHAVAALAAIDRGGVGQDAAVYTDLADYLMALPAEVERARLFQVDLVKPAPDAVLGVAVRDEIERGMTLLQRLRPRSPNRALEEFVRAFQARYEDREVELTAALDDDLGVGFQVGNDPSGLGAPLLADLQLPAAPSSENGPRLTPLHRFLLRRLEASWRAGDHELVLTPTDIEAIAADDPARIADAVSAMVTISAESPQAIDRGEFELLWRGAGGPSGARLLGRFCHASGAIDELVRAHLAAEEALQPEAAFAEIVHLNEGRLGNILCRPVLRDYEIPFLGISGAPRERQIPVQDLMVSVRNGRVMLRSRRLDREVIPRLSTAHNFNLRTVGMYRFLCALQLAHGDHLSWDWGPLASAGFLPRVRCGRLVLARARWLLQRDDLAELSRAVKAANQALKRAPRAGSGEPAAGYADGVFEAAQALRRAHRLPRYVVLVDADNELVVDLDNPLLVESFAWLVYRRPEITLVELYPAPERALARGPEGRFTHELALAFTRAPAEIASRPAPSKPPSRSEEPTVVGLQVALRRRFVPGSEWLYAKLYTGQSTADRVLRRLVAPLIEHASGTGAIDSWFFLRFNDPEHHLRVRFRGDPERLCGEVLPALQHACAPLLADGSVWRVQLDTYERELERYGGPAAIELCERIFWRDSEAVIAIVELLEGDEGADARWRLAARGADMLLDDLGLDSEARYRLMLGARDAFRREFRADADLYKQIGGRFRTERDDLFAMLSRSPEHDRDSPLQPGYELLARRSEHIAGLASALRDQAAKGRLRAPISEFAWSLVHMHINRLLHAGQRAQELVLYDFLHRWYASQRARQRNSV